MIQTLFLHSADKRQSGGSVLWNVSANHSNNQSYSLLNTLSINPILCWILNIFHFQQIICTNILTEASLSLSPVMKNEFILLRTSVCCDMMISHCVITRLADCLPDKQFYTRTLISCVSGNNETQRQPNIFW